MLKIMVEQIDSLSNIIQKSGDTAKQQFELIDMITGGIKEILEVVNENTFTSEESATVAQELASQSDIFRKYVLKYNLKKCINFANQQ